MYNRLFSVVIFLALLLQGRTALASDSFYVVAAMPPGLGAKITSLPYTISSPGFYYLGSNLTSSGSGAAITIAANNVTLDLMGFTLTGSPGNSVGINLQGSYIEVRNCSVTQFSSGTGVADASSVTNNRVINVRASYNV